MSTGVAKHFKVCLSPEYGSVGFWQQSQTSQALAVKLDKESLLVERASKVAHICCDPPFTPFPLLIRQEHMQC